MPWLVQKDEQNQLLLVVCYHSHTIIIHVVSLLLASIAKKVEKTQKSLDFQKNPENHLKLLIWVLSASTDINGKL